MFILCHCFFLGILDLNTYQSFLFPFFGFCVSFIVFKKELARVALIIDFLKSYETYPAFIIWKEALEYGSTYPNFLFGQGIGVFSRGSQLLYDYSLLYGSTESFFIQMFVEIGVFGVVIFGLVLIKAFLGLLSYKKDFASHACIYVYSRNVYTCVVWLHCWAMFLFLNNIGLLYQ